MFRMPSAQFLLGSSFLALALAVPVAGFAEEAKPAVGGMTPITLAPEGGDPVVARVNGSEIHRSDVIAAQHALPPQIQNQPIDTFYPLLIDQMISNRLVTDTALKEKYDQDPEVLDRVAKIKDRVVEQIYLDRLVTKATTEEALKAKYDAFVKGFTSQEEIHASHILVEKEEEAKAIIAQLEKGADFAKLADEKSTDKTDGKPNGGDLGYFMKDQMVPEFGEAAFKLKKGEITKTPVKTQFGYHVIKVVDRRNAPPPTFDAKRELLSDEIAKETIEKRVAELKATAKIETFTLDGKPLPEKKEEPKKDDAKKEEPKKDAAKDAPKDAGKKEPAKK